MGDDPSLVNLYASSMKTPGVSQSYLLTSLRAYVPSGNVGIPWCVSSCVRSITKLTVVIAAVFIAKIACRARRYTKPTIITGTLKS